MFLWGRFTKGLFGPDFDCFYSLIRLIGLCLAILQSKIADIFFEIKSKRFEERAFIFWLIRFFKLKTG